MPRVGHQYSKEKVSSVFDHQASYYSNQRGNDFGFQAQVKIVMQMLSSGSGLVLDLGCAAGAEIQPLLSRGFRVVGVEYSAKMLTFARQRYGASNAVYLCRGDAESLPFASATFDHVICLGVFEYLSTYGKCLDEIHRVLRPGGLVIISMPTCFSLDRISYNFCRFTAVPLWRAIKRLLGKRSSGQPLAQRWNLCNPWRFPRVLREHDFSLSSRAYSGFLLFPLGELCPKIEARLCSFMERFSKSRVVGWTLSQYLVSARRIEPR